MKSKKILFRMVDIVFMAQNYKKNIKYANFQFSIFNFQLFFVSLHKILKL